MKYNIKLEIAAPVIFLMTIVFLLFATWLEPRIEHVDQEFLKSNIGKNGVLVVDVRDEEDFYDGHIKGAINFPLSDLKIKAAAAALARAGLTKRTAIILYCERGTLSEIFGETLVREFGYSAQQIKTYSGGMKDWLSNPNNIISQE